MLKKILFTSLLLFTCLAIFSPLPSLAQTAPSDTGIKELQSNLGSFGKGIGFKEGDTDLKGRIAQIVNIALGMIGIVAVVFIIVAGYKWIIAEGNEEEIKKSKETIRNAVIGLLVVFISYIVVNFVVEQLTKATTENLPGSTGAPGGTPTPTGTGGRGTQ